MKKTEIMRRFLSAAAAAVIAVTSVNFTAVTSFAADGDADAVFTDIISKIDLSEYEVGHVVTAEELASMGLDMYANGSSYEVPVVTVKEQKMKIANAEVTRKYLEFELVPKKTHFSLNVPISISEAIMPNTVNVTALHTIYSNYDSVKRADLYKIDDRNNWTLAGSKDGKTYQYKVAYLPEFNDFAQLQVPGSIIVQPRFRPNADNPSNDGFLTYDKGGNNFYGAYLGWFESHYTINYDTKKLNTHHIKSWTTAPQDSWEGDYTLNKLPQTIHYQTNEASIKSLADDSDATLRIGDIEVSATYDADDTIKGVADPATDITVQISNGKRGDFWSETVTTDARGNYSVPVNFAVCGDDAVVTVTSGDNTYVRKAKYAVGTSEKVLDMSSFLKDENSVYFADLKLNGGYSYACANGVSTVSGSLESVDMDGEVSIVAAVYGENGEMKQMEKADNTVAKNAGVDFSFDLNTASTDTVKIFAIEDFATAPTIIASSYVIGTELSKKDYTGKGTINATNGEYNPVSMAYEVSGEYTADGYVVIAAENSGVKYFGVYENEMPKVIIPDAKANEKNYTVNVFDSNGKKALPAFDYVSSETFNGYFATLNSASLSLADFTSVITNADLKLENADYTALADDTAKESILRLFKQYKPASISRVGQVQDTLDKALGIYIFVNNAPTKEKIDRYAAAVSGNKAKFDTSDLDDATLADIASILAAKERTEENVKDALENAFIAGVVKNADEAAEAEQLIAKDFASYIGANTGIISKLGLEKSDVYGYVVNNSEDVTSAADVKALFEEAVNYIRNNGVESEITINGVKFFDANDEEHSEVGDYLGNIKAQVSYTADAGKELNIVLSYYKNSVLLNSKVTTITTDASGVYTTDLLDISRKDGAGEYKVEAKMYSSLSSLASCTDEVYAVTETVRTNVLEIKGVNFGGFETGDGVVDFDKGTWRISNFWGGFENSKLQFAQKLGLVSNLGGYNENIRSGNYAAFVNTTGLEGGMCIGDTISGATVAKDDYGSYWVTGTKGVLGYLRDSGAGKYRLTAYVKTGLNTTMRLAVNHNGNRTYGNFFKTSVSEYVEKGKWTKISTEFTLSETLLKNMNAFSINIAADACFNDEGDATEFVSQIYYVDDVSLVKLDEQITDEDANLEVSGVAEANEGVEVMIVNTNAYNSSSMTNADIAYVGNTTADENGKFKLDVTFDGNESEYSIVIKCGDKTYLRPLGYATEENGKKIVEVGYFDVPSLSGAYIENISIDGQKSSYATMKLPNGTSTINASVYSVDKSGRALMFVSVFNSKGEFKKAYTVSRTLLVGNSNSFNVTVDAQEGDSARIFLVDNVDNMNLLGNAFEISNGLSEFKAADSKVTASNLSTKFSPSILGAKVSGNVSKGGYVTVFAVEKDAVKNVPNVKYADFCKADASTGSVATVILEEKSENAGKQFDVYLGNCSDTTKQTFTYKMSSSYQSEYDKLNGNPSASTVESVVGNSELDIDMTMVSQVPSQYRTKMYELFAAIKPSPITSVSQIQKTIDEAAEIVIAATNPTVEFLIENGEKLGLNAELFAEFNSSAVSDIVRNDTVSNMKLNIPATINKDTLNKSFESAYVASYIKNVSVKYQDVQTFATNKFKSYINLDETRPSKTGKTLADVFKVVYTSRNAITSIANLVSLYNAEADKPKPESGNNNGNTYTPGGGGGGGGRVPSGVTKPQGNTPSQGTTQNEIFVDVAADYWAAPSILKLKNKGVISEDKYYRPNDNVSREEFVKMIVAGFGLKANGTNAKFADMADGAWYYEYVMAAADNNIVGGIGNNMFGIGQSITRQDAAVIIGRVIADALANATKDGASFTDEADIADYAKTAVAGLSALGIINGYDDGTFGPNNSLTRAECAKIIAAVLDMAD